jgi:hypothetical protein
MNPLTRRQAIGTLGALALPWEQLLAQVTPSAVGGAAANTALPPDLVNLHPIIDAIARERPLRLSFLDAQWRVL